MRKFILLLFIILVGCFFIWYEVRAPLKNLKNDFIIESGESVKNISSRLAREKIIRNAFLFKIYLIFSQNSEKIQAGQYLFLGELNLVDVVKMITAGAVVSQEIEVRLLEGWTIKQMDDYLWQNNTFLPGEFIRVADNFPQTNYQYLKDLSSLEGYLFPDTYKIYRDGKESELIKKMLDNFSAKVFNNNDLMTKIQESKRNLNDIIIMASILEKEVKTSVDKKKVADLFYRRLSQGMALQADSTVNYATGKSDPAVSGEDLIIDSKYNTYKYRGLPPGPICNPGLDSIMAAIEPENNDYWYFLTTSDTGEVMYGKTFDEHKKNKEKYLK